MTGFLNTSFFPILIQNCNYVAKKLIADNLCISLSCWVDDKMIDHVGNCILSLLLKIWKIINQLHALIFTLQAYKVISVIDLILSGNLNIGEL